MRKQFTVKKAIQNYYNLLESGYGMPCSTEGNGGAGYVYISEKNQLGDILEENTSVFTIDQADSYEIEILKDMAKDSNTNFNEYGYYTLSDCGCEVYILGWFE